MHLFWLFWYEYLITQDKNNVNEGQGSTPFSVNLSKDFAQAGTFP